MTSATLHLAATIAIDVGLVFLIGAVTGWIAAAILGTARDCDEDEPVEHPPPRARLRITADFVETRRMEP